MKQLCLLSECRQLYTKTAQEIQDAASQSDDELKWIEWAFGFSVRIWMGIEKISKEYRFLNPQEEICFYKTLQPQFIGLIDHFALLYKSLVFLPEDCKEQMDYWSRELDDCKKLISSYNKSCRHYEEQQAEPDIYFLKENNQQPLIFGLNVSLFNVTATSYSYVLGRLIALRKYKKAVQEKMYQYV